MKATRIASFVLAISLSLTVGMDVKVNIENISGETFLQKSTHLFLCKLELYMRLINGGEIDESLSNRIEDLIKGEIQVIDDWAKLYYSKTSLPPGVDQISPIAAAEHYSRIKSVLDEMRIAAMGLYDTKAGAEPSLAGRIEAIVILISKLDKILHEKTSELDRISPK